MAKYICPHFEIECPFAAPNAICPGSESGLCPATQEAKDKLDTPIPPGPGA